MSLPTSYYIMRLSPLHITVCLKALLVSLFFLFAAEAFSQEQAHPSIFISAEEAMAINEAAGQYPLLDHSLKTAKATVALAMGNEIEVPQPGEAGGYEHERHKQNYREMRLAGLLFSITGKEMYAEFVREMLLEYAALYPTLGPHPLAHNQRPGKLFHQTLNEQVWLVHTSIAYDSIYDWLSEEDRALFESSIFRPMAAWFVGHNAATFDKIHNHGTWAVAAVGMIGLVMGDDEYVEMALRGTDKSGEGGFLRQLDLLFSPDGYYMEGPYYIRYALMPFFYFAEALERARPAEEIYEYRNQILKKALYAVVQTSFPNGVFPPINDASRSMGIAAPEVILAVDLAYQRYGANDNLLGAAGIQGSVILNGAGLEVAKAMVKKDTEPNMSWGSVEFADGHDGEQGGLGILRMGEGRDQSMLLMKYGVHGEGHGHFDKLHFIFFDQGREVVPDYGFSRWINIEPKFGGRYLPENDSYAMQTVAHNTVVVDQKSQNDFNQGEADKMSGQRHFFDASDENVKVMSARADGYYEGVEMQRTMLMIQSEELPYPVAVDLYRLTSEVEHSYDYPIHFRGQIITSTVEYETMTSSLAPLGHEYGYQHIWKTASGMSDEPMQVTWLDGNRYYSLTTAAAAGTEFIMGRVGANDPNFNLISDPLFMLRRNAKDHLFASVIEPHGYFNEARERSVTARSMIAAINVIAHTDEASVVEVLGKGGWKWTIIVNNDDAIPDEHHQLEIDGQSYSWKGNFHVELASP